MDTHNCVSHLTIFVVLLTLFSMCAALSPLPATTPTVLGPCNDNSSCTIHNSYCDMGMHMYNYLPTECGPTAVNCQSAYLPPPPQYYWCICQPGYQAVTRGATSYCEPIPKIRMGAYCQSSEQCSSPMAVCLPSSRICDCRHGYTPSADLTQCLPLVMNLGRTPCQDDNQCRQGLPGLYSHCIPRREPGRGDSTRFCQCTSDSVEGPVDQTCHVRARRVGDHCKVNSQCTVSLGFSLCIDGHCRCNVGYGRMEHGKCADEAPTTTCCCGCPNRPAHGCYGPCPEY